MRSPVDELKKQLIDQPLHALWGLGTGLVLLGSPALPQPWTFFLMLVASGSCWIWTRRERLQFRDGAHVPWDPILDNTLFWLGFLGGSIVGNRIGA